MAILLFAFVHACPAPLRPYSAFPTADGQPVSQLATCYSSRGTPPAPRIATPNATRQALAIAGATQERTLAAVACTPLFGAGSGRETGLPPASKTLVLPPRLLLTTQRL